MTKTDFIATHRRHVVALYPWAQDAAKLKRYMDEVERTLRTRISTWSPMGSASTQAWHEIGGKGKVTLSALRQLPD